MPKNFYKQVDFAKYMIESLDIASGNTRVGAILYNDQIQRIFDLNEFSRAEDMKSSLNKVSKSYGGGSHIDKALRYIRAKSFRRRMVRPGAAKVAVVIVASPSRYVRRSKVQASHTRSAGITVIPIGIGDVNLHELKAIAGPLKKKPPFFLPSFDYLPGMLINIARETCSSKY